MKKYRVNVNGTSYEVEIELIDGASAPAAASVSYVYPARTFSSEETCWILKFIGLPPVLTDCFVCIQPLLRNRFHHE